jgi:hypothetical protein
VKHDKLPTFLEGGHKFSAKGLNLWGEPQSFKIDTTPQHLELNRKAIICKAGI